MPYDCVRKFESEIAEWAGAKHAIAVESGSAALFLSCLFCCVKEVTLPKFTYPSVPAAIIHAGGRVRFTEEKWEGVYNLEPYPIVDGALRFRRDMYRGGLHCLSFHVKKHLSIGRGGMILTDEDLTAYWLRLMRFDGREEKDLNQQKEFIVLGWNMYMQPEQAARGLQLFSTIKHRELSDLLVEDQGYPNLSQFPIFRGQ